jgi:hypothetical protein
MGASPETLMQGLAPNGIPSPNAIPSSPTQPPETNDPSVPKKKNFLQKIFGGSDKPAQTQPAPPQ